MWIESLCRKFALAFLVGIILAGGYGLVSAASQDVIVSVSTNMNAYGWGETVAVTVSVTNIGSSTLDFVFPDNHQAGCTIYRVQGQTLKPVWTTYNDGYYPLVTYLSLEPGETKDYMFEWAQTSETNTDIKPATYVIKGYFMGTWTWSEPFEFDIRGHGYSEH